jgi:uncharacterized membrane protein
MQDHRIPKNILRGCGFLKQMSKGKVKTRRNPSQKLIITLVILSAIGIFFSFLILLLHKNNTTLNSICTAVNSVNSCLTVQESKYAAIFGIDNAYFGIAGFFFLFVLSLFYLVKKHNLIFWFIILGSFAAGIAGILFLYAQAVLINAFCLYCLVVDLVSLVLLVLGIGAVRNYVRSSH